MLKTISLFAAVVMGSQLVSAQDEPPRMPIHPQWSSANGDIVFYERKGDEARLIRLNPHSKDVTIILEDGAYNGNPSWSPDGKHVAFSAGRPSMRGEWNIYRMNLETGEQQQLTNTSARVMHPSWSPDGKWIAHVRMAEGNSEVWLVSSDGRTEKQLTYTTGREFHPKWASDSNHLIFDAEGEEKRVLHLLNVETGKMEVLEGPDGMQAGVPAMSPDMARIVYSCRNQEVANTCLLDRTSGETTTLVAPPKGQSAGGFYFSPDGKTIAFHMNTEEGLGIYRMSITDKKPVLLYR